MRFDASPWFSCEKIFFSRDFSKKRNLENFSTGLSIPPQALSYYYYKQHGQRLDTIEIAIAFNCFIGGGIDKVFNMTILVGFRSASWEDAIVF